MAEALARTRSDVGGSVHVFDVSGSKPRLLGAVVEGQMRDGAADPVDLWQRLLRPGSLAKAWAPGFASEGGGGADGLPAMLGSRSMLWVPILDGKTVVGAVHVESSRRQPYGEADAERLGRLAEDLLAGVHRNQLVTRLAHVGFRGGVCGSSPAFLQLERQIRLAARLSRGPVLITGERGCGKEVAAWAIHCWSDRWEGPFLPVLASTFGKDLFTDELFGHEKHAFTGAERARRGKFQTAAGGSLFLDEVGDLTMPLQSALLRVIETGELVPIGRDLPLKVDVKVLTATNRSLETLIKEGNFREDLYDRLSVFEVTVPPLRERRDDIAGLTAHFVRKHCNDGHRQARLGRAGICAACGRLGEVSCLDPELLRFLERQPWPGNVRQLEHLVIRLLATAPDETLQLRHLPAQFFGRESGDGGAPSSGLELNLVIKRHIERVLRLTRHNQTRAAALLGIPLSTMRSKMKKLQVQIGK